MKTIEGSEIFTLFYILMCLGMIYPPAEFVSAGITIKQIFLKLLGNETEDFIKFHIKRSCLTLLIFSLFPIGYIVSQLFLGYIEMYNIFLETTLFWKIFATTSITLPFLALYQIKQWTDDNYTYHPTAMNLAKFATEDKTWQMIASDINIEYRRISKISLKVSAVTTVVITDNWVLKVDPFVTHVAELSDTEMHVVESRLFNISQASNENQVLKIEVKSLSNKFSAFHILLNLIAFRELESQINRRINVSAGITIHRTDAEQFIDAFKDVIKDNPKYQPVEETEDRCIGCFQATPNIKLQKLCSNRPGVTNCTSCQCRPSWCVQCMGQWFASRQNPDEMNQWLASKCTCPMCRSIFCVLDVCMLRTE